MKYDEHTYHTYNSIPFIIIVEMSVTQRASLYITKILFPLNSPGTQRGKEINGGLALCVRPNCCISWFFILLFVSLPTPCTMQTFVRKNGSKISFFWGPLRDLHDYKYVILVESREKTFVLYSIVLHGLTVFPPSPVTVSFVAHII